MKLHFALTCLCLIFAGNLAAQVLPVKPVTQEQTEWCWAGVSKSLLALYQHTTTQCEIAEFTRTHAVWHSYGSQPCCTAPSGSCNYWNYPWGTPGSIQDIILNFKNIGSAGIFDSLKLTDINTEISNFKPFIIRWVWNGTESGHFLIGHGVQDNMVYYMDPYPGEGSKIATHNWIKQNAQHTWTHTLKLTTTPAILTVSTDSINIESSSGINKSFGIFSNLNWTVSSNQAWLTTNIVSGSVSSTLTLQAAPNNNINVRNALLTVSAVGVPDKTIKVTQAEGTPTLIQGKQETELIFYPNPTNDFIQLNSIPVHANISIYDNSGKQLLNKISRSESEKVNISLLNNGVYTIIISDGINIRTGKIIKK